MSTTNYDCEYWPFTVSEAEAADTDFADKIEFLKAASEAGAESYKFGVNNYGAKSAHRSGIILERGRRRWEIRLSQNDERRVTAFTGCFASAGAAVTAWLHGNTISRVLDQLKDHLVVPPGLNDSCIVYKKEQD